MLCMVTTEDSTNKILVVLEMLHIINTELSRFLHIKMMKMFLTQNAFVLQP